MNNRDQLRHLCLNFVTTLHHTGVIVISYVSYYCRKESKRPAIDVTQIEHISLGGCTTLIDIPIFVIRVFSRWLAFCIIQPCPEAVGVLQKVTATLPIAVTHHQAYLGFAHLSNTF